MKKFGEGQQPFHAIVDIPEGDSQELTTVTDQALNSLYGELFNLLQTHGINPTATTNADLKQVARAVWAAVNAGTLFIDSGTANVKLLTHVKGSNFLYRNGNSGDNGFIIEFLNKVDNTGAVTVNVFDVENNQNHFNAVPLVDANKKDFEPKALPANSMVKAYYDYALNKFIVINIYNASMTDSLVVNAENIPLREAALQVVESVSDLAGLTKLNKRSVFVKSYYAGKNMGGGLFTYDAAKESINDGGVVIGGWVRQIFEKITPTMFGAYADDKTNDVPAIQKSIDYAVNNSKVLDFEGRQYVVKKESYTGDVLQSFFNIKGSVKIIGNLAKIRIDQKAAPAAQKILTLFRPLRKDEDATNYAKSIGKVSISGFYLDGGFDFVNSVDLTTIQDVKKCFLWYGFEVILDELKITDNYITQFAQQNIITNGGSISFKNYGMIKRCIIKDNHFYDNGINADSSTLYLMSKNTRVAGNKFQQPKGRENLVLCAMELHGTGAVVDGNEFINITSWVNLATNTIEDLAGEYVVKNNYGETIQSIARLWSGESTDEAPLSDIIIENNNAYFIESTLFNTANYNRALVATGGFNSSLKNLIIANNTARVQSISESKPVYFFDLAVQLDWFSDINNIVISGNAGIDLTGFASIGRNVTQYIDNCYIRNITVNNNTLFSYADVALRLVTINQVDDPSVGVTNLAVNNNLVSSNYNKLQYLLKTTGSIGALNANNNIYNGTPITGGFVFAKTPIRIVNQQPRVIGEYADISAAVTPTLQTCLREYLAAKPKPASLFISGLKGTIAVGVFLKGTRIKAIRFKLPFSITGTDGADNLLVYIGYNAESGDKIITEKVSILNKPSPIIDIKISEPYRFPFDENGALYIGFEATNATMLNNILNTSGAILIEFEVEKLI